jgi:hypothetical protein
MHFRTLLPLALAAAAAVPAAAIAQDDRPGLEKARVALDASLAGDVVTVTPLVAGGDLRVHASGGRRLAVRVDDAAGTATFDLVGVDGETFTLQRERRARGQVRFRLVATVAGRRTRHFNVVARVLVPAAARPEDRPRSGREDRGRGPETPEQREDRREREGDDDRGRGRGPETAAQREARRGRHDDRKESRDRDDD